MKMKLFSLVIIFISSIIIVNVNTIYAKCDCTGSGCTLITENKPLLVQYASCYFLVYYSKCEDNSTQPPAYNIKIDRIIPMSTFCQSTLFDLWIHLATLKVLSKINSIFNIPNPATIQNIIFIIPSCMEYVYNNLTLRYEIKSCPNSPCCEVEYNLKLVQDCEKVINAIPINNCDCINPIGLCRNTCQDIVFPQDTCLQLEEASCNWWCTIDHANTYYGFYDSTYINNPGSIEVWNSWGMNDDTLCTNISEIYYNPGDAPNSSTTTLKRAIQLSLWHLFIDEWGHGNSVHYIRISMSSCYYPELIGLNEYALLPCYLNCCSTLYEIELNGNTMQINSVSHNPNIEPFCDDNSGICYISACDPNIYANDLIPAPRSPDLSVINNNEIQDFVSYISPNPSNNRADIYLLCKKNGTYQISIFDVKGVEILKTKIKKTSIETIYHLNTSKFQTGVYNYKITKSNKILYNGKFIVVH